MRTFLISLFVILFAFSNPAEAKKRKTAMRDAKLAAEIAKVFVLEEGDAVPPALKNKKLVLEWYDLRMDFYADNQKIGEPYARHHHTPNNGSKATKIKFIKVDRGATGKDMKVEVVGDQIKVTGKVEVDCDTDSYWAKRATLWFKK